MGSVEGWLSDRPPEAIAGSAIILQRWSVSDVGELAEAVNETIDQLRPWMPWAQQPATPAAIGAVVHEAHAAWDDRREFQYVIRQTEGEHPLVGCCGLHNRIAVGALEIGYWVRDGHMGRGIATEAARLLAREALALGRVERVVIRCDAANVRSAAIPLKLGFRLDRVELRPPDAPGETDRHMVWTVGAGGLKDAGE